jgi:hypothetical protein
VALLAYPATFCPTLGGKTEERKAVMKPRLLLRAFCVGSALLVPTSGLTVLGFGTAGAATVSLVATSNLKLGAFGTITMSGITLFPTTTVGGIQKNVMKQLPVKNMPKKMALVSYNILANVLTSSGTKTITSDTTKDDGEVEVKATTGTSGFTGCEIINLPTITYSKVTALKWAATTVSLTSVSVTGSCTTKTALEADIFGHKLSSTMTFSAA